MPDAFKKCKLSKVTNVKIQDCLNEYSEKHSAKSCKNLYGVITAVLGLYFDDFKVKVSLPMNIKKEPHIPSESDVKRLCECAKGTPYWIPIVLGSYGLRLSEIKAITADDISDDNILTINKAIVTDENNKEVLKQTTKTKSSTRQIVIPEQLAKAIKEQGPAMSRSYQALNRWLTLTEEALGMEHFSLHKLRHFYATVMSALLPEADWLRLGGWSTPHIAKSVYRHSQIEKNIDSNKEASELMQEKILGAIDVPTGANVGQ